MFHIKMIGANAKEGVLSPCDVLANAIILQAVKDFHQAWKCLKRSPDDPRANKTIREIIRFFKSRYFNILTRLDGPALMQRLIEEEAKGGVAR